MGDHSGLLEELQAGIAELTTSETWMRYLEVQSRFYSYSIGSSSISEVSEWVAGSLVTRDRGCSPPVRVCPITLGSGSLGCAVGGVGDPVAVGESGPSTGGAGVDADELAENGGWNLGDELGSGAVAHDAGFDADGSQPLTQCDGADRLAGVAAGEQPTAGDLIGDAVGASGWELRDEGGERFVRRGRHLIVASGV